MKQLFYVFLSVIILGLSSCGKSYYYSESISIPESTWTYDNVPSFSVDIENVDQPYNLILELTHSVDFAYQNIYVKFHVTNPSKQENASAISLELANKGGVWYGDCSSKECTIQSLLQQSVKFPEKGTYTFKVEQYLREEAIEGVSAVGISVEEVASK